MASMQSFITPSLNPTARRTDRWIQQLYIDAQLSASWVLIIAGILLENEVVLDKRKML